MKEKEDPKIDNVVDVDVPTASKFVTGVQPETLFEAAEKEADEEEKKKEEEEKVEIAKEVESKEDFSVTATKTQKAVRVVVEDDDDEEEDEDEKEEEQKAAAAEAAAVMAVTTTPPPKTEEEKMEEEDAPITQLKDENGAGGGGKEELTVPDAADLPVPLPPTPFAGTSSPAVSTKRPSPMSHKEGDKVLSSSDDAAATAEPKEEEEGSPNKKAKTNFADAGPTIVVPEEA